MGAATLAAGTVQAQQNAAPRLGRARPVDGEVIDVFGERLEQGLGTRYTAPLLETPQTITLVPREIIDQQNLLTMREVLSTLPGITFTAGEGGGGYGDGVNLRGYTASNDISTDGVRDSAQYSRTDPFNLEQLELVSGANSVYTGAGSVGGSINLVTKTPRGMADTVLDIAGGSDSYARLTLDSELAVGDVADFRLNLMTHQNDVPGRDVESFERWGVAPSVAFGGDSDTRFTLSYLHQEDDNVPQYGVPYALGAFNDGPLPGVPTSAYYGYANVDTQEIGVDALTASHDARLQRQLLAAQPDALAAGRSVLVRGPAARHLVRRDRRQSVDGCRLRRAGHLRPEPRRHGARYDERDSRQSDGLHASSLRRAGCSTRS